MQFNGLLFDAIEHKKESDVVQEFQPLVKKLSANSDYTFYEDVSQELDIEVLKIFRISDAKLMGDFFKYLDRLDILVTN